jgi:hypothetical protein
MFCVGVLPPDGFGCSVFENRSVKRASENRPSKSKLFADYKEVPEAGKTQIKAK